FFKALYGRDREPADRILGWIDEALTMARRNGKRSGVQTLEALKLHVLARQGHSDIGERIVSYAETMRRDDAPGIERMGAYIQLAYAALEGDEVEAGRGYVAIAKKYAEEMGSSVPEFCQEVHMIAALYQLRQPLTSR